MTIAEQFKQDIDSISQENHSKMNWFGIKDNIWQILACRLKLTDLTQVIGYLCG